MRLNLLIFITLMLASYGLTVWLDRAELPTSTGVSAETLPDFSFTTLDGKTRNTRDFRGKIIILNFWASWCPPCVKEFPALLQVAARHDKDVVFIALSSDLDEVAIKNFGQRAGLDWQKKNIFIALDRDDTTGQKFGTHKLPETLVIGRDYTLRTKLIGAGWSVDDLEKIIAKEK